MLVIFLIFIQFTSAAHICDVCLCDFNTDTLYCSKNIGFDDLYNGAPVANGEFRHVVYEPNACGFQGDKRFLQKPQHFFQNIKTVKTTCCKNEELNSQKIVQCIIPNQKSETGKEGVNKEKPQPLKLNYFNTKVRLFLSGVVLLILILCFIRVRAYFSHTPLIYYFNFILTFLVFYVREIFYCFIANFNNRNSLPV